MTPIIRALLAFLVSLLRSRRSLSLQIWALRHQLAVYQRSIRRPQIRPSDWLLWTGLARGWARWRELLVFVQPATVLAWQRRRFRAHWTSRSRTGRAGRPPISEELQALIREISTANPRWGSPRILGELRKLGIPVAKSTVERYRTRPSRPASPSWRAFLKNHATELVAIDFFTVPTIRFTVLFVLIILAHDRRRILQWNVTEHPTAEWTAQQVVEAFPWETAPKYLLRDRDAVYGDWFQRRERSLGLDQVLTAPRSPWQKGYASHCTSLACSGVNSGRRLWESLTPWALRGGWSPGCSYSQSGFAV